MSLSTATSTPAQTSTIARAAASELARLLPSTVPLVVGETATPPAPDAVAVRAAFVGGCPTIVVVHVKDQVDGLSPSDNPRDNHTGEETFTGAAFAKYTNRTFDQTLEVKVDLRLFQFQRRADVKVLRVFRAEYSIHVFNGGVIDRHEMAGDGFHRLWLTVFD